MIIDIPEPDFSFEQIAKDKAKVIYDRYINVFSRNQRDLYLQGFKQDFEYDIKNQINNLNSKNDKLICSVELLNYLIKEVETVYSRNHSEKDLIAYKKGIDLIRYFIYSIITTLGYSLDNKAFNEEEVSNLNSKIDVILQQIEILKAGHEVIYNNVDEVKEDFSSLKSDFPLGKKRWYQRLLGIVVSFAGDKGGDEFWTALKPYIEELLKNSPHYLENITKMIG